jgi:steroid 5-alpha reductase family enzyme
MDNIIALAPAFAVCVGVFVALWPLSLAMRDVSIVDAWWGPGFLAAALVIWNGDVGGRSILLLTLVGMWAVRLGLMMIRRRFRHGEEDSRYQMIRESWGASFWWKSLFIVFLLQGVLQCIVALPPLVALSSSPVPLGILGLIGCVIAAAGLVLETIADAQLDAFKKTASKGAIFDTGLRAHVRHPNYTGEMIFWIGVWLIAAEAGAWWTIISPLLLIFLLTQVSGAPMQLATMKRSRPSYAEYAKSTPAFLPTFK